MLVIYDSENGEVLKEVDKNELLDLTKKATQEYLDNTSKIHMPTFSKIDNRLFTDVKVSNLKLFIFFISMVNSSDGILRYKNRKVTAGDLMKASGLHSRGYNKFINEMIEQDILKKVKIGRTIYYCFNPYLCSRGRRVKNELFELFKDSRWNRNATNRRNNYSRIEKAKDDSEGISEEN